jgi:hypothetical protein
VADGGEKRGANPVDLGEVAGVCGLVGEALGFQGAGGGGGEPAECAAVLGEDVGSPGGQA